MLWLVACIASMHLLLPIPITGIMPLVKLIWIIWHLYLTNTSGKLSFRSPLGLLLLIRITLYSGLWTTWRLVWDILFSSGFLSLYHPPVLYLVQSCTNWWISTKSCNSCSWYIWKWLLSMSIQHTSMFLLMPYNNLSLIQVIGLWTVKLMAWWFWMNFTTHDSSQLWLVFTFYAVLPLSVCSPKKGYKTKKGRKQRGWWREWRW